MRVFKMKRLSALFLFLFVGFSLPARSVLNLNGIWDLKSDNGSVIEAQVPGSVIEALLKAGQIPDPYYGVNENDEKVRAVLYRDWTFSRTFRVPDTFFEGKKKIELVFDSIDTVAEIFLNGEKIGSAENMFRRYRFSVDGKLKKDGDNTVAVKIYSPVNAANAAAEKYGSSLMPVFAAGMAKGIPYIRKSWFSYGWDWGIALPDSGLNRTVTLEAVDGARLLSVPLKTKIEFEDGNSIPKALSATVSCLPEIEGDCDGVLFRLTVDGHGDARTVTVAAGEEAVITLSNPRLWYTHDLGRPDRYSVKAELLRDGIVIDSVVFKAGIRELNLIRKRDIYGESFYFELNKIPLFARGGNWIPCDTMIPRGVRSGLIEARLEDCLEMHYNMIRVWGGGQYEEDRFYEFCDANGILVWQDFPFACYATPHLESFYQNVTEEVKDQLRRLVNRPSLAVLCGNNEIEKGWKEWGFSLFFPKHKPGYRYLFEELLPSLSAHYAPQIPYWPSSPSAGGNFKKTCHPRYGDSHNWNVWHGGLDYSSYRRYPARFMSEFGFQSFPDMETIRRFTPEGEESFNSPTMKVHQKNWAGNGLILSYMKREFDDPGVFDKQVVLSQITQALAMECGIDYWRAHRKNEQCMGALYWQINDTWPTASWSAVDYYGNRKALFYYSKRFFAPVTASVLEEGTRYQIFLVNDTGENRSVLFDWKILTADGEEIISGSREEKLDPVSSVKILNGRIPLSQKNEAVFFWKLTDENGEELNSGMKMFGKAKKLKLKEPGLQIKDIRKIGDSWHVSVAAEETALFVFFEAGFAFEVSDCFFSLPKGECRTVLLKTGEALTGEELKRDLKIKSLVDLK